MSEISVLQENTDEKLREVSGPRLPPDYRFLKEPSAREGAWPVNFDFLKSGGKLLPAKFVYNTTQKGLQIGPILFRPQTLVFKIRPQERRRDFIFEWPGNLPHNGRIKLLNAADDKLIWEREFDKWDLGERLVRINVKTKTGTGKIHFYRWTDPKMDEDVVAAVNKAGKIKYCVSFEGENFRHQLCTAALSAKEGSEKMEPVAAKEGGTVAVGSTESKEPVVSVNDKPERPKGIIVVGLENEAIKFRATWADSSFIEVFTRPLQFEIVDAYRTPEKVFLLRAKGATPYEENVKFLDDGTWETKIKNFRIYVSGTGEIPFYQEFFINQQMPAPEEKIKIQRRSFVNTYAGNTMLYGYTPKTAKITSVYGPANKYEGEYFTWNVNKLEKGKTIKTNIGINYGERDYQGVVEVYRGYQLEIGARLSGVAVVQNQQLLLLSDFVMNYWSETFFGSKNYWLGQQRWGLKLKYLSSITNIDLLDKFSSAHLDIAYRLMPGIWERDATMGLLLGYQAVSVNSDTIPMLGGGAFWARSMPQFFDRLFNIIPWFRYPKWVDMELIWYFMTTDPNYRVGTNFLYNFHGKMLLTPRFYIEGGGSMRQISYGTVGSLMTPLTASFVQGTLGVGYNF